MLWECCGGASGGSVGGCLKLGECILGVAGWILKLGGCDLETWWVDLETWWVDL